MTVHIMLTLNLLMAVAIFGRLFAFTRPQGAKHKPAASLVAAMLMATYASVAISIMLGQYQTPHWSELGVNFAVMVAVYRAKGNAARIVQSPGSAAGEDEP